MAKDGIAKLAQEIVKGFTQEEMENCDGYKLSNCCGAFIDRDGRRKIEKNS